MLTASARPDPNAPFARAEITIFGLPSAPATPAFQLRRSNVDWSEPNLDLTGWTRAEIVLLPLDAWWIPADRSLHLLISGLLCQYIDPGPLKLRLPGPPAAELDLFWPEDISVYDDGNLAAHARALTDTIRTVGPEPASPPPAPPPPPEPIAVPAPPATDPPASERPATEPPAAANPWAQPAPAPPPPAKPKRRLALWSLLLPLSVGAAIVAAVANRHNPQLIAPARTPEPAAQPRPADDGSVHMRAALDGLIVEPASPARRADFDPFLAVRPVPEIIAQTSKPEALLRYGATKLDQREPVAADRLFEEATRPRFGPSQNRPYAPAFVARGLLYDPSVQHDMILPVPNAGFAESLYRRAIASGDMDALASGNRYLQRLLTWNAQHPTR